jgi:epoxyqueuosine reductase
VPVLGKAWEAKGGLGWIGKTTISLPKKVGSFYFITKLIVDLELEYDFATTDHCGICTTSQHKP